MSGCNFDINKSVLENLKAMSGQKEIEIVAKECDIAFCRSSKQICGLEVINDPDPLKAALDYASKNNKICLVHEHSWFCMIPSRLTNLAGWLNAHKLWLAIDEQKRISAVRKEVRVLGDKVTTN